MIYRLLLSTLYILSVVLRDAP